MFAEEKKQNIFRNMLTLIDIGKIYLGQNIAIKN